MSTTRPEPSVAHPLLVDAHVHFYAGYGPARFFDAAFENFRQGALELDVPAETLGCLLFSETPNDHYFKYFSRGAAGVAGPWTFHPTEEDCSLFARRGAGEQLLLVAGRQIATREDLEVLALATTREYPTGLGFTEALQAALDSAGAAVLPWGFGKWSLRRGAMVREVLQSFAGQRFFLGDNGGRLAGAPRPKLFDEAERNGHWVLPGSDPLPLNGQERRVGSYGFLLDGMVDPARPASSLVRLLHASPRPPSVYGRLESLSHFVKTQVALQARKRLRKVRG